MTAGEVHRNYSANLHALYHLSDVNDSSVNAYNLTNNNVVTFIPGKFGNGANFVSASSQSLTVTATNANVGTSQTWLMWYKGGTTGGDSFPMGFMTSGGSDYKGIQIQDGVEQRVAFYGGTTLTPNNINAPTTHL